MARRATYFFDVQESKSPQVRVSGGWEFLPTTDNETPEVDLLHQIVKAYELLNYDVEFIGHEEEKRLAELGVSPDRKRKSVQAEPVTIYKTSDGHSIGFIRLPSLPEGEHIPNPELISEISITIKRERENTDLIVALSDWGWVGEREYLGQSPEIMPDILLGSGLGSGSIGRLDDNRRCSWNRPYEKGKTVVEIRVNTWPDRTKPAAWTESNAIQSLSIGLSDKYLDNPDVNALFQ